MFRIGDIVTGLTEGQYALANSLGTFEVVMKYPNGMMRVKVISHTAYPEVIGECYDVVAERFQLVKPFDKQSAILAKIAHLNNLFEGRKK